MRDGILAAMTARSASLEDRCDVWDAFADYGIGVGANGVESCFLNFCGFVGVTQSFVKPAECSGGGTNTAPTVQIDGPVERRELHGRQQRDVHRYGQRYAGRQSDLGSRLDVEHQRRHRQRRLILDERPQRRHAHYHGERH